MITDKKDLKNALVEAIDYLDKFELDLNSFVWGNAFATAKTFDSMTKTEKLHLAQIHGELQTLIRSINGYNDFIIKYDNSYE